MITVDSVLKSKETARKANLTGEDELKTTEVKPQKYNWWPWLIVAGLGIGIGIWWYKKGKQNGEVSG
jgi:hypothetical protein